MARSSFREIESLATLKKIMSARGAVRLYVKKLAPNDNSKNQPYLGGDFQALTIIPNKGIVVNPKNKGDKYDHYKARLDMYWVDADNRICPAPSAQIILYPKYPEIRLSGFLQGCEFAPSESMSSRAPRRRMFLGVTNDGKVLGHVTGPENPIYREIEARQDLEPAGVFFKIPLTKADSDTRDKLIKALRKIHRAGWLESVKMGKNGVIHPYKASNGGGYLNGVEKVLRKVLSEIKSPHLKINNSKTVLVTKKYRRVVTGLILANDGSVSLGHDRKKIIRAAVHHAMCGKLDKAQCAHLAGLLAFVQDVEPEFLNRLTAKYGYAVIAAIRKSALSLA
jgi:hypothetical protein